jgi:Family of unknown function (DUF6308)
LTARTDQQATLGATGRYADGRSYQLPTGWPQAIQEVLDTSVNQALVALRAPQCADRIRGYYNREGDFSGTTFLDVQPNDPFDITAADLWAVATLNVPVLARHGRLLLDANDARTRILRQLELLDSIDLPIADLEQGKNGSTTTLDHMWNLHHAFRSLLSSDDKESIRWVFAAKMCARKRPRLFPVRDQLVCRWLGGGRPLRTGDGWPGDFSIDIQVYAYLMTHEGVRSEIARIHDQINEVRLDEEDLRLLDVALWRHAKTALA